MRQAKIRTRMLDHSGTTTARNSSVRHFGGATRAMNHASGNASAMSTSVTIAASRIVRQKMRSHSPSWPVNSLS